MTADLTFDEADRAFDTVLVAGGPALAPDDRDEQQADEDGDDGDHHQQLDQGEPFSAVHLVLQMHWLRAGPKVRCATYVQLDQLI